jgi:hypothetical protein
MKNQFIEKSLALNLFFLRIMKEHSLFLAIAFSPNQKEMVDKAKMFNQRFNQLLSSAIELGRGIVPFTDDFVTKYTVASEKATTFLTGVPIDTDLTESELYLSEQSLTRINDEDLLDRVRNLNNQAFKLTMELIDFKTMIIDQVLSCKLYTVNYPLLIEHIRREAILYANNLARLQKGADDKSEKDLFVQEIFWNRIMGEHSEFIRGLLDPTEESLIQLANRFAIDFKTLNNEALNKMGATPNFTNASLNLTRQIREFKIQGTEGLLDCKIRSIIIPLLGDHVIREANHFLKILENR